MPAGDGPSLAERPRAADPDDTGRLLAEHDVREVATALQRVEPGLARDILDALPADARQRVVASASPESRRNWSIGEQYPEESVGRVMEAPVGVFTPGTTVGEAREMLRDLVTRAFITYAFVVDDGQRLAGVITMRDLL